MIKILRSGSCYFKRLKNYAPLCLRDQLVLTQLTLEKLFLVILNENLRLQERFAHATGVIKSLVELTGAVSVKKLRSYLYIAV